jgi:hypothetical protein
MTASGILPVHFQGAIFQESMQGLKQRKVKTAFYMKEHYHRNAGRIALVQYALWTM